MPEDPIVIVEETTIERKPVPVFKIAATTTAAYLVVRNFRARHQARKENAFAERMAQKIDDIMNREHNPFAQVTPEDIIKSTSNNVKD